MPNGRGKSIARKASHEGSRLFAAVRKPQHINYTLGLPADRALLTRPMMGILLMLQASNDWATGAGHGL
jgi:hypothetical protein